MVHDSRLRQHEGETSQQHFTQRRAPRKCLCNDQCRQELQAAKITARSQRIELFESWKAAGDFDRAEKFYEGLLANDFVGDIGSENAETILNLKQSYVDMLIKQGGRLEKALDLAKEVWDKRQAPDPMPDVSKECHRHLCSIYASLNRPEEAERMHKLAYEWYRGRDDAWALENGDQCCEKLAQQHKYDEAALMQANIWAERQKPANGGPRHPDTIRSGKSRIALLEKLSATLTDQAGTESEKNMRRSERETCEHKIDQALQYIWNDAENPEQEIEFLDVGQKLGHRLLARQRFPEAEAVLKQVWQGRKPLLEQNRLVSPQDTSTVLDVRYNLGRAMYHQGQVKYTEAAGLLQSVYDHWYDMSPNTHSIRECGRFLLEIYKHQKTGEPVKAIFDGRKQLATRGILYLQSGYAYGKLLVEQENHELAREPMRSLWEYEATSPKEREFCLRCGRLYGQTLLKLEQYDLAQDILQAVLEAQTGVFGAGTSEANKTSQLLGEAQQAISARAIPKLPVKNIKGAAKPKRRTGIRYSY